MKLKLEIQNNKSYVFNITIESKFSTSHHFGNYIFQHNNHQISYDSNNQSTDWFNVMNPSIYRYVKEKSYFDSTKYMIIYI